MRTIIITTAAALAANANAQCTDWQTVPSPNPSNVINAFEAADANADALYALLIQDDSQQVGNALVYHLLRRDADAWTDLGGPLVGDPDAPHVYYALDAEGPWLGGTAEDDPSMKARPIVARRTPDGWLAPEEIDLPNQVVYPFYDRGGRIYAMDTAPDGTIFAVGVAQNLGLTDDSSIPLFLANDGTGWTELVQPTDEWPGAFGNATRLEDVVAFADDDVWAVGFHAAQEGEHPFGGLIVHWDGSDLIVVDGPSDAGDFLGYPFNALDARAPDDIWAVGGYVFDPMSTTIAHYDGTSWTRYEDPYPEPTPLYAVTVGNDGTTWATSTYADAPSALFDADAWTLQPPIVAGAHLTSMAHHPDGRPWTLGSTTAGESAAAVLDCDCPADVNGDGALDVLDFVAFQQMWQDDDPDADCDADGSYDVLDFVCYQSLFEQGCP